MVVVGHRPLCLFILPIVAVSLISYWGVWTFGIVNYDDNVYLSTHRGISLTNIWWAFTTTYFSNWHPLTWVSYILDYQLFGSHYGWYHLENLFLHIGVSSLLFLFLVELTKERTKSLLVALLFAVHPLHVQSVAWLSERKDCLSALFLMATLIAYLRYVSRGSRKYYAATVLLSVAGAMSKSMLMTLPVLLMLLDFCVLKRLALQEKLPLYATALWTAGIAYFAQNRWGSNVTLVPFNMAVSNAIVSYVRYIGKLLWPANLSPFYPFPSSIPLELSIGAAAVLVAFSAIALSSDNPYVKLGWLWFLVALLPVIGIVKIGLQAIADRYMYIPSIGCLMVAVWGIKNPRWLITLGILAIILCMIVSRENVSYWRDSITLWSHAIDVTAKGF